MSFNDVVEVIKNLSTDEKREIQLLLHQYLREERRDEIYSNFKLAQVEQQNSSNSHYGEKLFQSWKCQYCKDIEETQES